MSDSALVAYRATIVGFLMTCTIKNSWLADTANQQLLLKGATVDLSDPTTWKYYINLIGEYHESDTPMTVLSIDTQLEISFDRDTLQTHPRTKLAYRPGTTEYIQLCARYPDQTDLIKNIVFPVADIETAIAAKDFVLLGWGTGYLEDTEEQVLVHDMVQFLNYVSDRWYFEWLEHEVYYRPTFWACLWQHLVALLHVSRIQNIHTAYAHTFHVWEYLKSQGIGDYRDVLTRRQAMFLYRNMRHIRRNRGRQENLILLVNRLLTEQSIAMLNKVIWHEVTPEEGTLVWNPEFVSEPIETDYVRALRTPPPQTVQEITLKLNAIGADHDISADYIERVTRRLSASRSNRITTKLLEIQPVLQDRKFAPLINGFILDNLVRAANSGQYRTEMVYQDPNTGVILRMVPKSALALIYYSIWRANGETPVNLPSVYSPLVGTFRSDLSVETMPTSVRHRGAMYPVSSVTDIANFIAGGRPPSTNYISADEFASTIGEMFQTLVTMINTTRYRGALAHVSVLETLRKNALERMPFGIALCISTTCAGWLSIASNSDIADVIDAIELLDDPKTAYSDLASGLLEQLVPPSNPLIAKWLDNAGAAGLVGRIKELFVQLCSYNVLFLDTEQDRQNWVLLPRILLDIGATASEQSTRAAPTLSITQDGDQHRQKSVYRLDCPGAVTQTHYQQDVVDERVGNERLTVGVTLTQTRPGIEGLWAKPRTPVTTDVVYANIGFSIINKTQDE